MVWLVWNWHDSVDHNTRKAHYADYESALAQAEHDLALCVASGDYSSAPVHIIAENGEVLWRPPVPQA
ncbi:hypothetical protein [Herbidospora mongoliensis]|uniref:hypothetical protein n=1 Tax=Herbidospora mongoliensis TaxID=688067 RepID=UPI0008343008|nr:hypothetical protein [Herbidospora mongoliensis]